MVVSFVNYCIVWNKLMLLASHSVGMIFELDTDLQ